MGFRFGHDSLRYRLYDPECDTLVIEELVVTTDLSIAFQLMGYDIERYRTWHWHSLLSIFSYVISSPFMHPDSYLLENRNNKSRVRDAKRKTYMSFLKWLRRWRAKNHYPKLDPDEVSACRAQRLELAFQLCPDFHRRYHDCLAERQCQKTAKDKFDGHYVTSVTGVSGRVLGTIMSDYKSQWTPSGSNPEDWRAFHAWCSLTDRATVHADFNAWWIANACRYQLT